MTLTQVLVPRVGKSELVLSGIHVSLPRTLSPKLRYDYH